MSHPAFPATAAVPDSGPTRRRFLAAGASTGLAISLGSALQGWDSASAAAPTAAAPQALLLARAALLKL